MGVRDDIVSIARSYLGVPYKGIYQGTGPEDGGFTCSGLVWRAYHEAGLDIPVCQGIHSYYTGSYNGWDTQAGWLIGNGHLVTDPDLLLPGDIVLYSPVGDLERTGHVAIYAGDGMVVHANGAPVSVDPLDAGGWFVGGGWPLPDLPEEQGDEPAPPVPMEDEDMDLLLVITDKNTVAWMHGDSIHDLTDPDDIRALNKVYEACHDGEQMPWIEISADWYGRLCQCTEAGYPKHLQGYTRKFPPRSPR